jgi:hypothetical protein
MRTVMSFVKMSLSRIHESLNFNFDKSLPTFINVPCAFATTNTKNGGKREQKLKIKQKRFAMNEIFLHTLIVDLMSALCSVCLVVNFTNIL